MLDADVRATKAEAKLAAQELEETKTQKAQSVEARLRAEEKAAKKESAKAVRGVRRAKTVQGSVGFEKMYEDGVCMIRPGLYSRTIAFDDVGYQTARAEDQSRIFNRYCELLNYLNESIHLQLNLVNNPISHAEFNESIFLKPLGDGNDGLVDEYNRMLADKSAEQTHTIDQQRFFTVSVNAPSREKAAALLANATSDIMEQLHNIGSESRRLDGKERLALLSQLLRPGEKFSFDYEDAFFADMPAKDAVVPDSFDFRPNGSANYFKFGDKFGEVLYFRDLPSDMSDRFLAGIMDLSIPLDISLHFTAMDQAEAIAMVRKKLAFMDQQRASEAKNAVRQGLDPSFVSPELLHQMDEATDLLDALRNRNQRIVFLSGMVFVWGDTYEELDNAIFQVTAEARKSSVKLSSLDMRQKQGMNACLPVGCDYSDILRTMTTAEAAIFVPFSTSELAQKGGAYYGQNQVSNNLIILNRKTLKAPMGWVLGKPGGGKSFAVKREIFNTLVTNPDDEVIVIDPMGEYSLFIEQIGGEVVRIDPASTTYLNPFDISEMYAGEGVNPVAFKSEFILTMMDSIIGEGAVGPIEHSIIDRVTKALYFDMRDDWGPEDCPTMADFYRLLSEQPEPEAAQMARAIELYTKGTLDVFNHHTNVSAGPRVRSYDTKALGGGLRVLGMLVVLDQVQNRASHNFARGVRTWLYIDEAQNFFENANSIDYFDKTYSEGRKKLIIPTAITQNVDRVIIHDKARQMLSNSDFILLLSQSSNDVRRLREILSLSPKEVDYVTNSKPGWGLLLAGSARVPFKDDFPTNTRLYELFSTDPNEREERMRRKRAEELIAAQKAEREREEALAFAEPAPPAGPAEDDECEDAGEKAAAEDVPPREETSTAAEPAEAEEGGPEDAAEDAAEASFEGGEEEGSLPEEPADEDETADEGREAEGDDAANGSDDFGKGAEAASEHERRPRATMAEGAAGGIATTGLRAMATGFGIEGADDMSRAEVIEALRSAGILS